MLFNARSLCNKITGITEFLTEKKCDVCFITEAWMKLENTSKVADIRDLGYNVILQPRKGKRGGGVCVLYKDHINIKKCNINKNKTFEVLEVIINGKPDIIRVSACYRTGKMSTDGRAKFVHDLDEYLQCLSLKKGEKILLGDFNVHVHEEGNLDRRDLYNTTDSYGFCQVVNQPTHKDGGTLDLVFAQLESNCLHAIQNTLIVYDLIHSVTSDHSFIEFTVPFQNKVQDKKVSFSYRDYKKVDPKLFSDDVIQLLNEKSVNFFNENVDAATNHFETCLLMAVEKHAPLIEITTKPKRTPFTNNEIIELRRKRRKAERMYRKHGGDYWKTQYDTLVKEVSHLVKTTRNNFYIKGLEACAGNKKDTFKLFDKLLGKNKEMLLPAHDDEAELCNEFEQYFYDKVYTIRNDISKSHFVTEPFTPKRIAVQKFNNFSPLTSNEVTDTVNSLHDKYCKLDPISAKLFKQCLPYLLPYINYIMNSSLMTGVVPDCFKKALVKPKIKSDTLDQDLFKSFRPLSNLSFLSKALERCVLKQLVSHLDKNNLFGEFQSAYRKFHSCETAITKIYNDILCSLDKKQCTFILFLDLSAAFDTIDHSILLSTLESKFGITGTALLWFTSYLSKRKCHVSIGKCISDGIFLLFGVPQGSILGPILFILYISDIEYIAKKHGFKIHIYADDAQVYISFEKLDIMATVSDVEYCLREIKNWMSCNFLKINEDKTKLLLISSKKEIYNIYTDLCVSFSGNIIIPSLDAVNLGVTFDSEMSMVPYINSIVSKGYWQLNNFWNTADKFTYELKLQLVTSYILPLIDYCNITFTAASRVNINKLQKLLNSAVRFIFNLTGKRYRCSITPYLKKAHILPVEFRIKYKIALTVYKCFHDAAPVYLQELITPKATYSHLRSDNDIYSLQTDIPCSHYSESSFSYTAPLVWNKLPQDVKRCPSLDCFKKRLKSHYFSEYFGPD